MPRFTPPPWRIAGLDDLPHHTDLVIVASDIGPGDDEVFITNVGSPMIPVPSPLSLMGETLANARLLVRAPEMFELLRAAVDILPRACRCPDRSGSCGACLLIWKIQQILTGIDPPQPEQQESGS